MGYLDWDCGGDGCACERRPLCVAVRMGRGRRELAGVDGLSPLHRVAARASEKAGIVELKRPHEVPVRGQLWLAFVAVAGCNNKPVMSSLRTPLPAIQLRADS